MSIEIIGVIVAVIFGILSIVTVYPDGRAWLKRQLAGAVKALRHGVSALVSFGNQVAEVIKNALLSPLNVTLICALILAATQVLIALLNNSVSLVGITLSQTAVDAIAGGFLSVLLLVTIVLSFRLASKGPAEHLSLREQLVAVEAKSVQLEKDLKDARAEYKAKTAALESDFKQQRESTLRMQTLIAYLEDQGISIPENVTEITGDLSRQLRFEVIDKALELIPDRLRRKRKAGFGFTPYFDFELAWETYGSGSYVSQKALRIAREIGSDVDFYISVKNLILVRNKVFAVFTPVTDTILKMHGGESSVQVNLRIYRTSLLNELKQRKGIQVHEDSDLPLAIVYGKLKDGEFSALLTEAYHNA